MMLWKYDRNGILRKLDNLAHSLKLSLRCLPVCLECISAVPDILVISELLVAILQELHRCAAGFVRIDPSFF